MNQFYCIIRGPLGSGKTTIAKKLAETLKAKYFAVDAVLDKYNLASDESDKEDGYISQKSFLKVNEILIPQALEVLKNGQSVIFDGNFYWQSQIDDLFEKLDFPHFIFTLSAPVEVCIERDAKRDKSYGEDATIAVHKKSTELKCGIEIDVTKSLDECLEEIISYLQKSL